MTTLVTGAAGFIARHLAATLRRRGTSGVVGVGRRADVFHAAYDAWETADLTDASAVDELVVRTRPDVVFHLVGLIRGSDDAILASNLETSRALVAALRRAAPRARVVLLGSAAEYGAVPREAQPVAEDYTGVPTTLYGRVKQQVSALATEAASAGQAVMVARPFNVIGAGVPDSLVAGAIVHRMRAAIGGPPPYAISIGRTSAIRDFVDVTDVADGLLRVAELGEPGEAYNLCSGEGHSVAEVLGTLIAAAGVDLRVDRDEALLRGGDVDVIIGSRAKAGAKLGWSPVVSFSDSLRASWEAAGRR